jgi:putative SOS response-associated peptidase YedK
MHRRCLIIADGFYEWCVVGKTKTPVYIYLENGEPFGMAGIYEEWKSEKGEMLKTCSIITTEANGFMKQIHHRMPVILEKKDHDAWLSPGFDEKKVRALLKPWSGPMKCHEVSLLVNSAMHNSEECILPAARA